MFATWENVKKACDELVADGVALSTNKVINKRGGGSTSDIGPLVQRYREENPGGGLGDTVLPALVATVAQSMAAKIFELGRDEGRAAFDVDRQLFTSKIAGLMEDFYDSQLEIKGLLSQLEAVQAQLAESLRDRDANRARLSETEDALQRERTAHREARDAQATASEKAAKLEMELQSSRDALSVVKILEANYHQRMARSKPGPKGPRKVTAEA